MRSGRAVSPVVGVVIMVGIAVALAGLGASFVFGLTEKREPAPDVVMELEPTDEPVAHELTVKEGDTLRGETVEFRGTVEKKALSGRLAAGERTTVYPTRETVEVVWFGEHGASYVIATLEAEPSLPDVEATCNWVESETGGATSSVTVDVVVDCDVLTDGDVDVVDPGVVIGDVDSDQNTVDIDHGVVYGTVEAESAVDLDGSRVVSDVTGGGDVTITDNTTVDGDVTAVDSGGVDADGDSTIRGSVSAAGDVAFDTVTVGGDVEGANVDLADTTVEGDVVGTTSVALDNVTVEGNVYAPTGGFTCTDSTIDGQECGSYTSNDLDEYDG